MFADDAFPNSDQIFKQAFTSAADPVARLVQILNQYPTYLSIRDLVFSYTDVVEEDPSRGQYFASTLVKLRDSPDVPTIIGIHTGLWYCIGSELANFHVKVHYGDQEVTRNMRAAINDGLDAPHGSQESEVLVVGACIQLLLDGSKIATERAGTYRKDPKVVAQKLKAHKIAGTVKHPHAIQLLELTISHAETGLKPENDREDAWNILFPPKS
ncbi:hypothetical protein M413DRAFT_27945 [Hebeloma cylindrosporum]|uniref:Uncharacterized protein n=1 Tax=Hebeloma cylindrosporum TaxID=76867 RepID=A0A0C3CDI4_HEBCY|nr:hypothetical protein M413DRAFT_27945 [Hebeloma cylindrosporum h7]